ncbi:hypothetical protein [Coralloluteibacterium stylophorae]|uniref:Uncharacterized protein n=1 Tax=Coralloluteibacterium stylophorae TaxID=1776034 RepID=A0A8J7VWT5_9GAMM|nr:hypothetical protein [Coralloluteibacterium stylophorae]MBS7458377.1 hypothetical protein [Coralloluteibacterium stylophorae]
MWSLVNLLHAGLALGAALLILGFGLRSRNLGAMLMGIGFLCALVAGSLRLYAALY